MFGLEFVQVMFENCQQLADSDVISLSKFSENWAFAVENNVHATAIRVKNFFISRVLIKNFFQNGP